MDAQAHAHALNVCTGHNCTTDNPYTVALQYNCTFSSDWSVQVEDPAINLIGVT